VAHLNAGHIVGEKFLIIVVEITGYIKADGRASGDPRRWDGISWICGHGMVFPKR